ncbi:MAG: methyl-accepting chemotaxis protein, partial [Hyphomicrobiales bacterium]|nr:methyl-accepting chemotaxis protein [Hyphomicrobiales bacterium]
MFQLKISARIYLLVALAVVALCAATFLSINSARVLRADTRDMELHSIVDTALNITKGQYARFQAGKITEAEAQNLAKTAISLIRYRGAEYLFIIGTDGVTIMNPITPETVGTNRSQVRDKNGKLFQQEMIDMVKTQGSGFEDYAYLRPGAQEASDKRSYVAGFAPWGWMIGTGVYVDDLRAETWSDVMRQGGIAAVIIGIMALVGFLISRTITKPINRLTGTMRRIAGGEFGEDVAGTDRKDEIGEMSRAVAVFRENGMQVAQMTQAEAARIVRAQQERSTMMAELQQAF